MTTTNARVLCADAGRPDVRELSRVIAVRLLQRVGIPTTESPGFAPTGSVPRTPMTVEELVPGDPDGLAAAATALADLSVSVPVDLIPLVVATSKAHASLGKAILAQRVKAAEVFEKAAAAGIPNDVICHDEKMTEFIGAQPERGDLVLELAKEAITLRLAWTDAESDFVDALREVREELDIADW
ncbi:hypothetical protein [Actinobaculum sp. 352]|uniref:hypothetical protein n=1 Tax=Actinobaculum sp. 352 TaxID=2490946 RepID=UPI000F7E45E2|nr:hypothetical protein [Actinobaculum sp. 352]RTE50612.1 hypothetical protein EKN07_00160 [Actinobaculum sp. 352]